jgi:O-antigen biosynthesis protein WbqV
VFIAFLAAYELRLGLSPSWWVSGGDAVYIVCLAALYAGIAGIVEAVFRTERTSWRFSSLNEFLTLTLSTGVTACAFLVVTFFTSRAIDLPRSTLLLSWLLSLSALVGIRLTWRLRYDRTIWSRFTRLRAKQSGAPLALVGSLDRVEAYLRVSAIGPDQQYRAQYIFGLDPKSEGEFIRGVPVVGAVTDLLASTFLGGGGGRTAVAALLFLDDPIQGLGLTPGDVGALRSRGLKLLRQPKLVDLQATGPASTELREIKLEEFLPRAPIALDPGPVERLLRGRRALVTGAGGSIGSEVARQLVNLGCAHVTLVDHSEFLLFEIDRELAKSVHSTCSRSAVLCNVRDETRVRKVFTDERPDIVFHAAALKHVTLVENNPSEGALTNVLGTWNVAAAARDCGAEHMVMISTDKAVNPSNVMGATKRVAEAVVDAHSGKQTYYTVVRFGNVLGSAGSVVPIFKDQIEHGGPVTVTHEDVERFFMTIPEAVQLVLHATAVRSSSATQRIRKFVLEMGAPVKIVDLARQMIELSGARVGEDIAIKITGLRPGEKLTEELIDDNELESPCAEGITEICDRVAPSALDEDFVELLRRRAASGDDEAVRKILWSALDAVRAVTPRRGAVVPLADAPGQRSLRVS